MAFLFWFGKIKYHLVSFQHMKITAGDFFL
ncbi:hypothetical protein MNBD_DELTA03-154, partial [hydrothermal vent metagenome]